MSKSSLNQLIESYLSCFPDPETARLDAEILIAHALGKSRSWLKAFADDAMSEQNKQIIIPLLERRAQGEPVAYILGEWEFYSLPLKVTPNTLVPRPETELLVERALTLMESIKQPKVLDLGTGTGAIAITIKKHRPEANVFAVDFSAEALKVAQENAKAHKCPIEFFCGSWYEPLPEHLAFDFILSNPPYVANDDPHLLQGDLPHEPITALTAGDDEFADIRAITEQARHWLRSPGVLLIEHGYNQKQVVQSLFQQVGFKQIQTHRDYGRMDRFTEGHWI